MKVFTVFDIKTEIYQQPFFMPATGAAIRAFSDMVNDDPSKNQFAAHPEDYILYEIGSYDDSTGNFIPLDLPKALGTGSDFKHKQ